MTATPIIRVQDVQQSATDIYRTQLATYEPHSRFLFVKRPRAPTAEELAADPHATNVMVVEPVRVDFPMRTHVLTRYSRSYRTFLMAFAEQERCFYPFPLLTRLPGSHISVNGGVCIDDHAFSLIHKGERTPEDVFWNSVVKVPPSWLKGLSPRAQVDTTLRLEAHNLRSWSEGMLPTQEA